MRFISIGFIGTPSGGFPTYNMYLGAISVSKWYIGSTSVLKIYLGSTRVL